MDWLKLISLVLSGGALALTLWFRFGDNRSARARAWQRVVVHKLVEKASVQQRSVSLEELRQGYLNEAQELLSFRLPRRELGEPALRRIVLDLIGEGAVEQAADGSFRITSRTALAAYTANSLDNLLRERQLRPRVLKILERYPGGLTPPELTQFLQDDGVAVGFEDVDNLAYALGKGASITWENGRLIKTR